MSIQVTDRQVVRPLLRVAALLVLLPVLGTACTAANTPTTKPSTKPTTQQSQSPTRFEKEIHAFELADLKSPPTTGGIVFTGSSTIRRWTTLAKDFTGLPVLNRGFGGSMISDAVYFADRIVVPYKPKLIVFYSGGNDINAKRTPQRVFADFKAFVEKVRGPLPDVRIVYMGIGPSPKRWSQADQQKEANQLINDYILAGKNMDYVEVWDQFLGPDGKPKDDYYVSDHHHNNADGYKIRVEVLRPHLTVPSAGT